MQDRYETIGNVCKIIYVQFNNPRLSTYQMCSVQMYTEFGLLGHFSKFYNGVKVIWHLQLDQDSTRSRLSSACVSSEDILFTKALVIVPFLEEWGIDLQPMEISRSNHNQYECVHLFICLSFSPILIHFNFIIKFVMTEKWISLAIGASFTQYVPLLIPLSGLTWPFPVS